MHNISYSLFSKKNFREKGVQRQIQTISELVHQKVIHKPNSNIFENFVKN